MPLRFVLALSLFFLFAACSGHGGAYHTVKRGQTLFTISRSYGVDPNYLARINGISDPDQLHTGQQLFIPGAEKSRPVPVTVPWIAQKPTPESIPAPPRAGSRQPSATNSSRPQPPAGVATKKPGPGPYVEPNSTGLPLARRVRFVWPVRGKLLRKFGEKEETVCNGLEIAAAKETPVVAAAAGKVIYSGAGIAGYGNLIILAHEDSFYSVYGYNRENLVTTGAFVSKGEKIALVGPPPKGGAPRLYFEIRYGKQPVDPIFYLP